MDGGLAKMAIKHEIVHAYHRYLGLSIWAPYIQ